MKEVIVQVAVLFALAFAIYDIHSLKVEVQDLTVSRDSYAKMVGHCLEGRALWDSINNVAYFCNATPQRGL